MARKGKKLTVAFLLALAMLTFALGQEAEEQSTRKIVSRRPVVYPELARRMRLEGTVKLEVTVGANGAVRTARVIGGNPVLAKAAEDSIYGYRWVPANRESKELVEIKFQPE